MGGVLKDTRSGDIGTVATHDDLKNINEKLVFRKYLNELDLETIHMSTMSVVSL